MTLAVAYLLAIGLLRSYMIIDSLYASHGPISHELTSRAGSLTWLRHYDEFDFIPIQWQSIQYSGPSVKYSYWEGIRERIECQRNYLGYSAGTFQVDAGGYEMLSLDVKSICYSPIILLLTLLSMYLLLTKLPQANATKSSAT